MVVFSQSKNVGCCCVGEFSRREPIARKAAHAMEPGLILVLIGLIIETQNYKKSPFHRVLELKIVEIVHLIVDFLTPFAIFEHLISKILCNFAAEK